MSAITSDRIVSALMPKDCFKAMQFDRETCEPTGTNYFFAASSIEEAVNATTYYLGISGADVRTGPTGRVVYAGRFGYTVTKHA
jgi:hypothetical protein